MREAAQVDALFDLGSSSGESDIAAHKDSYVGDAVEAAARHDTTR
jgi:hypothetical protein